MNFLDLDIWTPESSPHLQIDCGHRHPSEEIKQQALCHSHLRHRLELVANEDKARLHDETGPASDAAAHRRMIHASPRVHTQVY
jgi:hypothetical protein